MQNWGDGYWLNVAWDFGCNILSIMVVIVCVCRSCVVIILDENFSKRVGMEISAMVASYTVITIECTYLVATTYDVSQGTLIIVASYQTRSKCLTTS